MINNKWFCEPNPTRESYCFVFLNKKNKNSYQQIIGWKIGIGSIEKIHKIKQSQEEDEKTIIEKLLGEFFYCRQKNIIVVTDSVDNFPILRARIARLNIKQANLAAIKYIELESLINKYFPHKKNNNLESRHTFFPIKVGDDEIETIWNVFRKIAPLIPREELQ